jgi:hypothetical protein
MVDEQIRDEKQLTTDDEVSITLKFKGTATAVVDAVVHGLPHDALVEFGRALDAEMAKRGLPSANVAAAAIGSER